MGLCPTRNQPDHFKSPKLGPPSTHRRQRFEWLDVVGFRLGSDCANRRQILPKSTYFCLIDRISKRSWRISTRLGRILKRSQQISTRSGPILKRSGPISKRSSEILSLDLDKSDKIDQGTTLISGESYFRWVFRSSRLKIGFPCFNSSTDLPVSGFGIEDPPLTVTGIGSAGYRSRSARLGRWVG